MNEKKVISARFGVVRALILRRVYMQYVYKFKALGVDNYSSFSSPKLRALKVYF